MSVWTKLLTTRIHVYILAALLGFLLGDFMYDADVVLPVLQHLISGNTASDYNLAVSDLVLLRNHKHYQYTMVHWIPLIVLPVMVGTAFVCVLLQAAVRPSMWTYTLVGLYVVGGTGYVMLEQVVEGELPFLSSEMKNMERIRELGILVSFLHSGLAIMLFAGILLLHKDLKEMDSDHRSSNSQEKRKRE